VRIRNVEALAVLERVMSDSCTYASSGSGDDGRHNTPAAATHPRLSYAALSVANALLVILSQHPLNLALIRSGRTVETCIQSLPFLPADVQHVILKVPFNHLPVTSPVVGASG
jgi:hypothetical protein